MTDIPDLVARLRAAGCVYAEDEAQVLAESASGPTELQRMVARRVAGEPLEIVVGWAALCGIRFAVAPGVFVPRRRTEFLVELARERGGDVALDLCCGSGAVGAAVQATAPDLQLHASDIDPVAVACARKNVRGAVYQGDLFSALPSALRGHLDTITLVAPYVPTDEIDLLPREARLFEPNFTLDGGADGLALVRRVAAEVTAWLAPNGRLLTEVSEAQAPVAAELFRAVGLGAQVESDEQLYATVVVATRG